MKPENILPLAFIANMKNVLGIESEEYFEALKTSPPVSIRLNPLKKTDDTISSHQVKWSNSGFYLRERPIFTLDPVFQAGGYYVQEASSMFLEQIVTQNFDEETGLKVLDLCAAPGGKSTHLASLINSESILVSNEVIRSRVNILEQNMAKWGNSNVIITNNDPKDFTGLKNYFDIVVTDAPCSGEGMFRKTPAAMNEWSIDNANLCSSRQKRILADIADCVKPGGILVYSTCTFNTNENEKNIEWLIENHPEFESVKIKIAADWNIIETVATKGNSSIFGYRFYPHKVSGEGFYISCLRKKESTGQKFNFKNKSKNPQNQVSKNQSVILDKWLDKSSESFSFISNEETIYAIPSQLVDSYQLLNNFLNIRSAGIEMGKLMKNDLIPSHYLALSNQINKNIPKISVSHEQALIYMKRENFHPETHNLKGWALVSFKGLNLGWVKVLDNRINNYLPKDWRIRMELE